MSNKIIKTILVNFNNKLTGDIEEEDDVERI